MTDIFRSAFQYLSQAGPNLLSSSASAQLGGEPGQLGRTDHPMVGSMVEIGPNRYRIRSLLAEGGYALVFAVQEQRTGRWMALKRQLAADREAADAIRREIKFLRELSGHPSIIEFVEASQLGPKQSGHGRAEFLLLTELCSGGTLISVLQQKKALSAEQVCKIFHSACEAVRHMHDRSPPITHRDIKIENLLFSSAGRIKLCDFGSATTDVYRPDDDWNALRRGQLEEEMARHTTPMYRAPEILDTYQNYPIGPPQDVWALGCILYYLCYRQHPFEDSAKLRILNAKYSFPPAAPDSEYTIFQQLIRESLASLRMPINEISSESTLQPNPYSRPSIQDLCERVDDLAFTLRVDLSEPVGLALDLPPLLNSQPAATINSVPTKSAQLAHDWPSASSASPSSTRPPRPLSPPPNAAAGGRQEGQPPAGEVIAQLKGQGLSLFKNLRDKGQQLAQSVLSTSSANDVVPSDRERVPPTNCPARDISGSDDHDRASHPPRPPRHRPNPAQQRAPELQRTHVERYHDDQLTTVGDGEMAVNEFDPFETCFPCRDGANAEQRDLEKRKAKEEKERLEYAQNPPREASREQSNQPQPPPRLASASQNDLPAVESKLEREKVRDEDLLGGWTYANSDRAQHPHGPRHVSSAPSFPTSGEEDLLGVAEKEEVAEGRSIDPLSELLASCLPAKGHAPNYSRTHFRPDDTGRPHSQRDKYLTSAAGTTGVRLNESTFNDLLSSHGFSTSGAQTESSRTKRTLADLRREELAKEMDPVSLKIADWTRGKEKNIRALLSSLHEVLWDDIGGNWSVPTMRDLLSNNQIKKNYYKACLVVHPDKQVGTDHELLAKAIFTELNDAWNKFDEERKH